MKFAKPRHMRPKLESLLVNEHLTQGEKSAVRWALATIDDLLERSKAYELTNNTSELTSETRS
jgi:hypothetical protein